MSATDKRMRLHQCVGVEETMTCRFENACCGEICIAPDVCRKREGQLTVQDKHRIRVALASMRAGGFIR